MAEGEKPLTSTILDGIDPRIAASTAAIAAARKLKATLEEKIDEMDSATSAAQTDATQALANQAANAAKNAEQDGRLTNLESEQTVQDSAILGNQTVNSEQNIRLNNIEVEIDGARKGEATLEDKIDLLDAYDASLTAWLQTLPQIALNGERDLTATDWGKHLRFAGASAISFYVNASNPPAGTRLAISNEGSANITLGGQSAFIGYQTIQPGETAYLLHFGSSKWHFENPDRIKSLLDTNTSRINGVIGQVNVSDQQLKIWASSENFRISSPSYSAEGLILSPASIVWPDGASGTLTFTRDANGAIITLSLSHTYSNQTKTVSKTLTRDSDSRVTNNPDWTVS